MSRPLYWLGGAFWLASIALALTFVWPEFGMWLYGYIPDAWLRW